MQMVELHFRNAPPRRFTEIRARAAKILGTKVDSSDPDEADKAFLLLHPEFPIEFEDGRMPAQTALLSGEAPVDLEALADVLHQSWACEDPGALLEGCRHSLLVTEMMTRPLPPLVRVTLFHGVLQAVVEETMPDALLFKHSQQVLSPSAYLDSCDKDPILRPGSINIRFFRISGSVDEMLMDTRGMEEIGLHDLQCHFCSLDPNQVSAVLFNTAVYIFEKGPVIESGQTVMGTDPESKWRCQFENALIGPDRELLDIDPGPPYAAGGRHDGTD